MDKELEKCRLTGPEVAGICGRFARLKDESKNPIGYSSLAEMAVIHTLRKAIPIISAETSEELDDIKLEVAYLNKKLDDREADLIEARKQERERIQKLYEDMGCVPEEDNCWYSFWQAIGGVQ